MSKLFLLACATAASLAGCCNDGCCKKCSTPVSGQAQAAGQVPSSPNSALAGRMIQSGAQPTSSQVLSAQQITPQNPGMSNSNSMSGRSMATESMAGKPATMDSMSR